VHDQLARNRQALLERLRGAALAAGRDPSSITVVAVTKTVAPDVAQLVRELGQVDLGENRLSGLQEKADCFAERRLDARWHFVGHLQTNKARAVLRLAHAIHSVDSLRLLDVLARLAAELGRSPEIYLEVKLSAEASKTGFAPDELPTALEHARALGRPACGLMTLAPLASAAPGEAGRRAARAVFERCADLARSLDARAFVGGRARLSMGMSGDLEEAVRAGADVVRVGTALFRGLERPARERRPA
jgi:pyridoxal phosphate enzyme (YggS family)